MAVFKTTWGILAAFCIFVGFAHSLILLHGDESWSDFDQAIRRVRRQANETEGSDDNDNTKCVVKHLKDIEAKLEKALPPEKNSSKAAALAKPHQIFSNADPNTLIKFCAIYKAQRARLAGCGESEMKSFAAKALAVVDFVCIDRYEDFISAFPCIQKVDKQMDAICQKNCSEFAAAAEKLNSAGASVVKKYTPREIKELFADSCSYVSCFTDCQKPALETQCGMKVVELEMSSIGVTFKNLDEMMSNSSASNLWPRECKPLSDMGKHEKEMLRKEAAAAAAAAANPQPVLPLITAGNATSNVNSTLIAQPVPISAVPKNSTTPEVAPAAPKVASVPAAALPTNSTMPPASPKPSAVAAGNSTARAKKLRTAHRN